MGSAQAKESPTMLTLIKPIIVVNQFLGVCPHDICGEILVFKFSSWNFWKTLCTILILVLHLGFKSVEFGKALFAGESMVRLGYLLAWLTGPMISILILGVTLKKRAQFTEFFEKLKQFKTTVCMKGINNCPSVVRFAWRFYGFYISLALLCGILVAHDTIRFPPTESLFPSQVTPIIMSIYQFYLVIITQSACALVEVFCATVSISIVNKIRKIQNAMIAGIEEIGKFNEKPPSFYQALLIPPSADGKTPEVAYATCPLQDENELDPTKESGPIMIAIKRFSYIAQKQRFINCIFGPILALDLAWLVIHVCLLFFLQIRCLGQPDMTSPTSGIGMQNETLASVQMAAIGNRVGLFAGQGIIYVIRLLIVLISLGNVHEAIKIFDSEVVNCVMKIRKCIKPSDLHVIQVHLLASQSNPVAFSAGGFFLFSRATILYVFSIVTTYVVFLLQA